MKLLFITQKIDRDDDILGVYHEWTRQISKSFDRLSVICLYKGRNELPENVKILSLGKESLKVKNLKLKIPVRLKYVYNFFGYIWSTRSDYDVILVHMNPTYVLLGWPLWKAMRKNIYLWFAHPAWNWQVKLAYILSDKVITSVPEAFRKRGGKVYAIGQGVDTELFKNAEFNTGIKFGILYLGRISPSKNIHILIEALRKLKESGVLLGFIWWGILRKCPGRRSMAGK